MEIAIIITIVVCFIITWIVIGANSTPFIPPYDFGDSYWKAKLKELEEENLYWKSHVRQLQTMSRPRYHDCICPCFVPLENFEKKYYAVDKERQDLVDIITESRKSAEKLIEDLKL